MELKLTQFSPGAGCGCKIAPAVLKDIIRKVPGQQTFSDLLVGCESSDDAAVMDLGNGQVLISTTDFFTPIADDPWDFGRIAAANALSDIYAMGGKPVVAISILGWPLARLPASLASRVIEGAMDICTQAGIPLAGGHSIDISDPVFGLAVTGIARKENIRKNNTAKEGDAIYLSKPLGIGILSTAARKSLLEQEDYLNSLRWMTMLNSAGMELGCMEGVHAMTDVTGFGLLGHLLEICEGSGLGATVDLKRIPFLDHLEEYISKNCIPGGTYRNWKSYGEQISDITENVKCLLADPQTSGGLLVAVEKSDQKFKSWAVSHGFHEIGTIEKREGEKIINVMA